MVDEAHPGFDPGRHPTGMFHIAAEHRVPQPVAGIVGQGNGILFIRTLYTTPTGPKTSLLYKGLSFVTSVRMVGITK